MIFPWSPPSDPRILAAFEQPDNYDWVGEPDEFEKPVMDALDGPQGFYRVSVFEASRFRDRIFKAAMGQPEPLRITVEVDGIRVKRC